MSADELPELRFEPDLSVTSASRAPTGPDFVKADRRAGSLIVNKWTYRPLRRLSSLLRPKPDLSDVTVTEESNAGRHTLIVRPNAIGGQGALLLIHGGGFVLGSNQEVLGRAAMLARKCGVPVLAPAYRLGPEHPFPAGLDDCHGTWTWLVGHAAELGVDASKVVVGGYSAGAGLAAALAQRIHDEGGPRPAAQLLVYPMLDDVTATRLDLDKPRHRVWSNRNNRFGWTSYLGGAPGEPSPPYAVPARRDDLSGLPPAWIGVGTPDLFLDEDRRYAERLRAAGVDVTYVEVDGGIHGFDSLAVSPLTEAFDESTAAFVRRFTA